MNTRSGREVKAVGESEGKKGALASLAKLRKGGGRRLDEYQAEHDANNKNIIEELNDEEYNALQEERRQNDFIVGDGDADGYKDHGGEIWEDDEEEVAKKTKEKANKALPGFFLKSNKDSKAKKPTISHKKAAVSNEKSSAMMDNLLKKLDNDQDDDIIGGKYEPEENENAAYTIHDQLEQKYDVLVPKAQKEEIKQPEPEINQDQEMEVEQKSVENKENDSRRLSINTPKDDESVGNMREPKDADMEDDMIDNSKSTPSYSMAIGDRNIPTEKDGNLRFFLIDAHEEYSRQREAFLYGKIFDSSRKEYRSLCMRVQGIERVMFVVPKEDVAPTEVIQEIKDMLNRRKIKNYRMRPVEKEYCFEMPAVRGTSNYIEVRYSTEYDPLPHHIKGKTYSHIFGKNTSILELLLVSKKVMGPRWITITRFKEVTDYKTSWCAHEITVDSPKALECRTEDRNRPSPPLKVMTVAMKYYKNNFKVNEICMISCLMNDKVKCDGQTANPQNNNRAFSLVRKMDRLPYPQNFTEQSKHRKVPCSSFDSEKMMLENFVTRIEKYDPDMIVGHELCQGIFGTLMDRMVKLRVGMWSKMGRYKKSIIPKSSKKDGVAYGGYYLIRQCTIGRLVCDTFLTAKELVREINYTLTDLARTQLGFKRLDFDYSMLKEFYKKKAKDLLGVVQHTENDADLTQKLLFKLAIIPLTKQLTNIAGNLWYRSLQNARAERNEWLLVHEFTAKNFICPDKEVGKKFYNEEEKSKNANPNKRKKAAYEGGLVLEPKPGLYDKIVLLLDFNSLYPSIIQEYDLCFTTVDRPITHNFDGQEVNDACIDEVDVPDTSRDRKAVLPSILEMLVKRRKDVKNEIKREKDQERLDQLDIKQKAFKLTANSMYGCLGFSSSRFYAKAIAALITRKGRHALEDTVKITTENLNYNVIYGDTDSVMIYSGIDDLKEAIKIGGEIKKEVNRKYKCLEIEIDGVFRSLLLLKKKKYAALVYTDLNDPNSFNKKEVKGLDMVRRDWCPLSKSIGNYVLKEILSSNTQDQIQINLRAYFGNISVKLKENQISLKEFLITKQVTKDISKYEKGQTIPHIVIAMRMKDKLGKSDNELINTFIPYVICKGPEKNAAQRAYTPDEFLKSNGELELDIDWYLSQQIYPPISRLIEHIEGIDARFICECFGLNPKKHNIVSSVNNNTEKDATFEQKFLDVAQNKDNLEKYKGLTKYPLKYRKPGTDDEMKDFEGLLHQRSSKLKGFIPGIVDFDPNSLDKKDMNTLPASYIANRIKLIMKKMLKDYYEPTYTCGESGCNWSGKTLLNPGQCLNKGCNGALRAKVLSEKGVTDTFNYLERLFNTEKIPKVSAEQSKQIKDALEPYKPIYNKLFSLVTHARSFNGYGKVDLGHVFGFLMKRVEN
ncbi:unnamed protein product [Moneuplotes crassus]|uniref:DNA polymerase n=2 Tax=Euplotes crassus TaxID=5936 RepID=A0AAD1U9S6_EUPCR|nr:unnamed protein product [Moneuplotes crassus]